MESLTVFLAFLIARSSTRQHKPACYRACPRGHASLALLSLATAGTTIASPHGEPVAKSTKRGVAANALSQADAQALAQGVSWFYNWHYEPIDASASADLTFYPMVWGTAAQSVAGLEAYLDTGATAPYALVLNEPNLKDQAYATPQQAAQTYRSVASIAARHGMSAVGPHMAIGSPLEGSITAYDPIEKEAVTFTFMIPYLDAFYAFLANVTDAPAIAAHSYGDIYELRGLLDTLQQRYPGKDIWITEFAWWGAENQAMQIHYMTQAVALFERTPAVTKYAWFKARMEPECHRMSLLTEKPGELSALGEVYITLPVGPTGDAPSPELSSPKHTPARIHPDSR